MSSDKLALVHGVFAAAAAAAVEQWEVLCRVSIFNQARTSNSELESGSPNWWLALVVWDLNACFLQREIG